MDLFISTCQTYIEDERLKEKYEKEKIGYVKQLNDIKFKINNMSNMKNEYKFNSLYKFIEKLKKRLNTMDINEIKNEINELEKKVNMYKIANYNNNETVKKSQILSSNSINKNYKKENPRILKKYSKLYEIINTIKTIEKIDNPQLFINNMFKYCDNSELENFIEIYEDVFFSISQYDKSILIKELKHLTNSLLISDIINIYYKQQHNIYENYLNYIKDLLKNDLDCIRSIGNYFGDDDYIYLPKFDIIDLKYCVRYGMKKKKNGTLIKIYIDLDTEIREPNENEPIKNYLKYLISRFVKTIDCSKNIEEIIKSINDSDNSTELKETINNLNNAVEIIELFKDFHYKYDFDWLINDFDKMKNIYWKEPGKIIVRNKYNSLLQFNDEKNIFNREKIIAKSLYAAHEANILNDIQCIENEYLKFLLNDILKSIYNDNKNEYNYCYRLISFYDKNIYKDNVAETMVTLIYSIFKIIGSLIDIEKFISEIKNTKDIIKSIIYNFIICCIKNESPCIDDNELLNIIEIIINIMLNKYEKGFENEINCLKIKIKNDIDKFVNTISEIEEKIYNCLEEKQNQYLMELNEYNIPHFKNKNDALEINEEYDEKNINEEVYEFYKNYIEKNTEENKLKKFYNYTKPKPINKNYDKKLKLFKEICEKIKKIKELSLSAENSIIEIINDKEIVNILKIAEIDYKYIHSYNNTRDELKNNLNYYENLIKENIDFNDIYKNNSNEIKNQIEHQYNIEVDDNKILIKWIKKLLECKINFEIHKHNIINNEEVKINKPSEIYSVNKNWIFDKKNIPNFLLDNVNINLGIYILKFIQTNDIGFISFDNKCSYSISYKLEQKDTNAILAYTTEDILQQHEPMNIKFRLNKNLEKNETIKCEFFIKLINNNNNEELDKCKVIVYLNVIPLCLKFKLNDKYNIDENNNISINHYVNSLEIKHLYPGKYSSNNLGIAIKSNPNNKYNNIIINQENGKIISKFGILSNKSLCSNIIDINLKKINLLHLNLNFITPKYYGLIIYDENGINIQSIDIEKGKPKAFYLFNMSTSLIYINYKYEKSNLKLLEEVNSIKPGEKKKLEIKLINNNNSEQLYINENKIAINILETPKLRNDYGYIYCDFQNRNIKNKLKCIIINKKLNIDEKKIFENNYNSSKQYIGNFYEICSCYLLFNNRIIDKCINKNKFNNNHENKSSIIYHKVYGFSDYHFCNNKTYNEVDIALKCNDYYYFYNHHIFTEKQMKKFSEKLNDAEFKGDFQSDDLNKINDSIHKLINKKFDFNKNIDENIEDLDIKKEKEKTSINNIIKYLIKISNKCETKKFLDDLKSYLKIMYNREILIPFFKVNDDLNEDIKQFLIKLSYIISFVDIVVNPLVLKDNIIEFINNGNDNNKLTNKNDKELKENFKKYFENGLEKDIETSELIYYNDKIYKHTKDDDFEKYNKQIENSLVDNKNYNKERIIDFIQTYKEEIQNIIKKINNNEINISNLFNILDECTDVVTKIPLILSTIENDDDLTYCASKCQDIYNFIYNLMKLPIYNTDFSERINSSVNEIQTILSKYEFFDLNKNKSYDTNISNTNNNIIMKSLVQCELPYDDNYENDLMENNRILEKYNQSHNNNNKRSTYFNNIQYTSGKPESYKSNSSYNNINNNDDNKQAIIKKNNKIKHKIEYASILSNEERAAISIPFLNDNIEQVENHINKKDDNNINDILDYENTNKEMKISMNILEEKLDKTTPTEFLEMVMEKNSYKNQSLSEIKLSKLKRKGLSEDDVFIYQDECSQTSSFIQSTISNLIKSNLKFIDNNKILPNSILDSFVDIVVDITHMSQIQRITALVISTGLSFSLNCYGINIRISVFGERDGVWLLSDDFSTNIETQLARLRDALASKKRFMSFPGDAIYSLKQDWLKRFNNKKTNYTSVLISSLISPQVVNKQINWSNTIHNKIIVFGLKSEFDEQFINKHKIYENLLKIPGNESQIIQEFLDPIKVIGQNESERDLLEKLCKSIVISCIYKLDNKDNFKENKIIVNNNINNTINETSLKDINRFINDNMEDKIFFGQNIPYIMTDISKINEEFNPPKISLPSANELLQNIQIDDNNSSISTLKFDVELILKSQFGLAFAPNTSVDKVPSASGGTLSIPALKKWIVSGFTYKEIFLKKAGKTKRKYSITIAIDFSSSIHLLCNYSHAISTALLLLLAPSTLQDNEEINIDVIISTLKGPKIMFMSSKPKTFESISIINSIINVIDNETPKYCTPGNTLNAAYQLQLQKGGVGMGKNIFFITDGYVTSRKEIKFANLIINSCENAGIDLMTIGVGSYPYGIKQLYPKCCYAPSLRVLGDAIAYLFSISRDPSSKEIIPQVIISNTSNEIQNNLKEMIIKEPKNIELQRSIEHKKMNYIEMIGNNDTMTLGNNKSVSDNPEDEPYYDGLFNGFNILIVILYLGGYEYQGKIRDKDITVQQFESGAGKALRKKGFKYKLVFSYGEAINELTKSIEGRCPYIETWLFCSRADGSLPDIATDKDSNKIIPFFKCIKEFNNNGGGLLLFCDNEPYTLETNILISEYLNLEDEFGFEIKPEFKMGGNYNQPDFNKKYIVSMNSNNRDRNKNGTFKNEIKLPPPGKCIDRISLRAGLVRFSEGITLSYAKCRKKIKDYSPFIPFAYLTDTKKEKPFILYYDPKIKTEREINQGPIVIHGGFTSAFYDFSFDGTGRLVTSIACWLVRYEERIYKQLNLDMKVKMVKDIPAITIPNYTGEKFTKWIREKSYTLYSIMVLDVSGSMRKYYSSLINMANTIINNQKKNSHNRGTIIFFGSSAKAIVNGDYRTLTTCDISITDVGSGTNFYNAFRESVKYINPSGTYDDKRLLFLTDGKSDTNNLSLLCDQISDAGFSIHILGFGENSSFNHLKPFVRRNGSFQVYSVFKDVASSATKILFAAE
eukprot:jgi/Orpsp1_1/1187679/evm.model.d7180000059405.1